MTTPLIVAGYDVTDLAICHTCTGLRGPVTATRGQQTFDQRCVCMPRTEERWPRFDYNQAVELCRCCARVLVACGSKWSTWFCDSCHARVREINKTAGRSVIPIGRHSLMNNIGLPGSAASDPAAVERFAFEMQGFAAQVRLVADWSVLATWANLDRLALDDRHDVPLVAYLDAVESAGPDQTDASETMLAWLATQ